MSDEVTVVIGLLNETTQMEEKGKGNKWEYKRPKDSYMHIKHMKIDWKKKEAKLDIKIDKAELDMEEWLAEYPDGADVLVSLQIGNDIVSEIIQMKVHKHHWDYKR